MRYLFILFLFASAAFAQPCDDAKGKPDGGEAKYGRGYKPLAPEKRKALYEHAQKEHGHRLAMHAKFQTLPASFDCRDKGWVLPVGGQAQCGSCYLYSTIYGTLSQAFVKAGYGKADGSLVMAVQYGMDCHDFGGCNGGNGTEVIDWVCKNGWYAQTWVDLDGKSHNDYPAYEARPRTCRKVPGAKLWTPAAWGFATGDQSDRTPTTLEIKTAMYNYGPLNVSLDAGGQFGNGTGTITSLGSSIDHEIEMVAWDDNKDGGAFLLKNQWTTDWGNAGYRWVTYKAAARIVDIFWVSVTPLPPAPVPPTPVPPGPATKAQMILRIPGQPDQTFDVHLPPSNGVPIEKLDAIQKLLDELRNPPKIVPIPAPEPKPVSYEPWGQQDHYQFGNEVEHRGRVWMARRDHYNVEPPNLTYWLCLGAL